MAGGSVVVADSIAPNGERLTTMELTFHRYILAEWNTYCMMARNAASSRAVPAVLYRGRVAEDPALPVWWGKNEPGMQAFAELDEQPRRMAQKLWLEARNVMLDYHQWLTSPDFRWTKDGDELAWTPGQGTMEQLKADHPAAYRVLMEDTYSIELHKQIANRLLENWLWVTVVATGVESAWANVFHQRAHWAAQPEFQDEAFTAAEAYLDSTPRELKPGEWHLPYVSRQEESAWVREYHPGYPNVPLSVAVSAARCASVSYFRQGEVMALEKELERYDRLRNPNTPREFNADEPVHASPMEHPALVTFTNTTPGKFGQVFVQHRKQVPHEAGPGKFTREDLERRKAQRKERFGR